MCVYAQSEAVARSPAVFGAMVSYIQDVLDVFGIDVLHSKVREHSVWELFIINYNLQQQFGSLCFLWYQVCNWILKLVAVVSYSNYLVSRRLMYQAAVDISRLLWSN